MADNVTINPGTGGAVIAADDVGGILFQRVKVGTGVDGAYADVSAASPLPTMVVPPAAAGAVSTFISLTSGVLLAANAARKGAIISNEGLGTLNILFGAGTASAGNYAVSVPAEGYYEVPYGFTGQLTGIFLSAGTARAQELT